MVKGNINSSTNSRSRKRIKKYSPAHAYHNKIYNDGLKKNNFLARHPKHRWAYANQEKMGSSYVTSISRPSVTTRGGRAIHFTPEQYEIQSFYVVEESFNLEIESQSFEEIIFL